jgi:hypothetical protein
MVGFSYGEGKAEGNQEEKLALAKSMLADQGLIKKIIKWTSLSREEVEALVRP